MLRVLFISRLMYTDEYNLRNLAKKW